VFLIPDSWGEGENPDAVVYTVLTGTLGDLVVLNRGERYSDFGRDLVEEGAGLLLIQ